MKRLQERHTADAKITAPKIEHGAAPDQKNNDFHTFFWFRLQVFASDKKCILKKEGLVPSPLWSRVPILLYAPFDKT